jgi:hypothetical protein
MYPSFKVLTAGSAPFNSAGVGSKKMDQILEDMTAKADVVF